jgi:hypothetical protein
MLTATASRKLADRKLTSRAEHSFSGLCGVRSVDQNTQACGNYVQLRVQHEQECVCQERVLLLLLLDGWRSKSRPKQLMRPPHT